MVFKDRVSIDVSQFGFVPGCNLCGLAAAGEIPSSKQEALYGLRGPSEAFDGVTKVIWWALRKPGVEESIVQLVQGMYTNERSWVRVGKGYSQDFKVKVGVYTQSLALHHCTGGLVTRVPRFPGTTYYADDLVIIVDSKEALDMERSHGEEGVEGKCRKDKGHDL